MRTLTYELDTNKLVHPTARVTFKGGREDWLCNPFTEVTEAMGEGKPFMAHAIRGMTPHDMIINPTAVASVEMMS